MSSVVEYHDSVSCSLPPCSPEAILFVVYEVSSTGCEVAVFDFLCNTLSPGCVEASLVVYAKFPSEIRPIVSCTSDVLYTSVVR